MHNICLSVHVVIERNLKKKRGTNEHQQPIQSTPSSNSERVSLRESFSTTTAFSQVQSDNHAGDLLGEHVSLQTYANNQDVQGRALLVVSTVERACRRVGVCRPLQHRSEGKWKSGAHSSDVLRLLG